MCGRASLSVDPDDLREAFGLTDLPAAMPPRYNMAPSQPLPVIREPGRLELVRWGLPKQGHGLGVNVRVETIARAPAYRESFWHRRCLVVVDGWRCLKTAFCTKTMSRGTRCTKTRPRPGQFVGNRR